MPSGYSSDIGSSYQQLIKQQDYHLVDYEYIKKEYQIMEDEDFPEQDCGV